ncbi:STAS domain-containing protein [Streptomyces sp. AF1A]|jgi:anti-anti-sigma factor|uniref:STAS domain-containing protein n=1 Tax=Streptomyces sp. AF1A TaxID=3394350 RepID=UPI0039BD5F45
MEVIAQRDERMLRITTTVDPPGLRLEGELDATRHQAVMEALSPLTAEGGEVRLDLAELRFIDLGALRLLTSLVERSGNEVRFVLDNLSPQMENLIETVGWERLPGLVQGRKETS